MPFITQGKANIKYILIVVVLAAIVGGGVLWWAQEEGIPSEIININKNNLYSCVVDDDCISSCGCSCINKDKFCPGDELKECDGYPCQCSDNKCIKKDTTADSILFEKNSGWGPCPPGAVCEQSIRLYYSGELILKGYITVTKQLDQETVGNFKNQIKTSKIMERSCESTEVLDYMATYKINLDGKTKEINFPGCENELSEIEKLIPLPAEISNSGMGCIDSDTQCDEKPNGTECTTGVWCDEFGKACGGQSCVGLGLGICSGGKCLPWPTESFCGSSTYGSCNSDSDCISGGCSGQVCQSKNEEGVITNCAYRDCYSAEKYGLSCKCSDSKCQWSK